MVLFVASAFSTVLAFITSFLLVRTLKNRFLKLGITGIDVHKQDKPEIPERVGIGPLMAFTSSICVLVVLFPQSSILFSALMSTASLGGLVGLLDDVLDLGGKMKPLISPMAALPLIISGCLSPRPLLPLVGHARMYYVYWPLILIFFTVIMNATNMADALNGMMPSSVIIVTLSLVPGLILTKKYHLIPVLAAFIASILPYYWYNKYPAKVFGGNVGSMFVGAFLAGIAAASNLEMFLVISMLPFFITGFMIIYSAGGFRERREMKKRPTLLEGDLIRANPDEEAPMTIIAILTSDRPKREYEIVREFLMLTLISGILSIASLLLTFL